MPLPIPEYRLSLDMGEPRTLAQKIWDRHLVRSTPGEPDLLYVDLHLVHEVTSPQAFESLRLAGRRVQRPELAIATVDHNNPTRGGVEAADEISRKQMATLAENWERAGMVAPDETTFAFLEGRRHAPQGALWQAALEDWRTLASDEGAVFDSEVEIDARELEPYVTWGTNPGQSVPVTGRVPEPHGET